MLFIVSMLYTGPYSRVLFVYGIYMHSRDRVCFCSLCSLQCLYRVWSSNRGCCFVYGVYRHSIDKVFLSWLCFLQCQCCLWSPNRGYSVVYGVCRYSIDSVSMLCIVSMVSIEPSRRCCIVYGVYTVYRHSINILCPCYLQCLCCLQSPNRGYCFVCGVYQHRIDSVSMLSMLSIVFMLPIRDLFEFTVLSMVYIVSKDTVQAECVYAVYSVYGVYGA